MIDVETKIVDTDKLKGIITQIEAINNEYLKLKSRFKQVREERGKLFNLIEHEINEMVDLEKQIKELRKKIRENKAILMDILDTKRKLRDRIKEINSMLKERPVLPRPLDELSNELERLETIYETSNLNRKQEKRIVEKINHLTLLLKRYKAYMDARKEKKTILEKLDKLDPEPYMNILDETKAVIDELKRKLERKRETAAELNRRKMEVDKEFESLLSKIKPLEERLNALKEERDALLEPLGIKADNMSFEEIVKILNNRNLTLKRALQKLSNGESLTFEEFSVLVKHGLV